ncbi:MAG: hypothetical protein AAB539_04135 [Patescibacteria group bacterium]
MNPDTLLKIIDTILQLILVIFAGLALSVWKKEIRGRDRYKQAKDLLIYIQQLRFLVCSKNGSHHQIYLNDIFVDRENFYRDQLLMIKDEMVYFDRSIWDLFNDINLRSNIFLSGKVRLLMEKLCPIVCKHVASKNQYTYLHLDVDGTDGVPQMINRDIPDVAYQMQGTEKLTIKKYFDLWEALIAELRQSV